jgi:hypothetical protein
MPPPTPELNDPTPIQEGIKTIAYAVVGFLTVFFAFSEKGLNLLERVQKLASARQKREEKIEALAERMETMLKQMQTITAQQHEATVNHRLQLLQNERWEKQITELERGIEECQKEIAYLRGKTDKP